jgi:outer membrane protein OmpA-like peptidoglycan-associated protein
MHIRAISLALLLGTTTAAAQSAGTFELNGFSRYARFDDTLRLQENAGGGGSLAFFPLTNLAVETEAAYTRTHGNSAGDPSVSNVPLRARLSYHVPIGGRASSVRLGVGYLHNLYRKSVRFDDDGFTAIAGLRVGFSERLGVRLDGTADYVRSPDGKRADNYVNWGAQAGLSLMLGNSSDNDRDGVKDRKDRCPRTPAGKPVDAAGCSSGQRDTDRDRVNDELDRCPHTPADEVVDTTGCAASEIDADRDGVPDATDRCPGTPAGERSESDGCAPSQRDDDEDGIMNAADRCPDSRPGEPVDASGCPPAPQEVDGDGDGVPDPQDHCPSTPPGQPIDQNGCPILFEKGARKVILRGVTFQTGKATLTPEARAVLQDIATQLVENPEYRVQISGHTDNTGSRAANLRLSLARARTVESFLEANGVPSRQVTSKGFGPDVPVASNKTAAGRAQNRRVELMRTN